MVNKSIRVIQYKYYSTTVVVLQNHGARCQAVQRTSASIGVYEYTLWKWTSRSTSTGTSTCTLLPIEYTWKGSRDTGHGTSYSSWRASDDSLPSCVQWNAKCRLCGSSIRWVAFILLFIAEYMIFWWRRPLVSVHSHWWPSGYICSTFIYAYVCVYKDWHWYKISVHSNCLEHSIECSSVQWNARACHRMRFFYQNVFSSYSFIVNDVWPARMHSIACSRMRLHSRAFHCMLENSNAGSSHVLYIHLY